jgi:rhodanese-related sulfurtransferase
MSAIAAEKLVSMGYTKVFNFQGGMRAWERSGRQLLFFDRK